jgi:hypothetical protein
MNIDLVHFALFRFLILEYVGGGELFDYLVKRGRLTIKEVIFKNISNKSDFPKAPVTRICYCRILEFSCWYYYHGVDIFLKSDLFEIFRRVFKYPCKEKTRSDWVHLK